MANDIVDPEIECLKLKKTINDNHRMAQTAAAEAVERGVLTGDLLGQWKELLPHGRFEKFTDNHFDGSLRTAQVYMQAAKRLNALPKAQRTALLKQERSIAGLIVAAKKDVPDPEPESSSPSNGGASQPPDPPEPDPDEPDTETDPAEEEFPEDETLEEMCERETSEIESWARQIAKLMKDAQEALKDVPTLDHLNARGGWERSLQGALSTLRFTKPVVCPMCQGEGDKTCPCKGNGRVTKQQYGQMV